MAVLMNRVLCLLVGCRALVRRPVPRPSGKETDKAGDIKRNYCKSTPSGSVPLYPPCSCLG